MKQFLLFFFLITTIARAQFNLNINGQLITTNTTYEFSEIGNFEDTTGEIEYVITNPSTTTSIYMEIVIDEIVNNANGDNVQLCWDVCFPFISVGESFPATPKFLPPGVSTAIHGNHFKNLDIGDNIDIPVSYVLRFHQVDGEGVEVGTPILITYKFDETLGMPNEALQGVTLYPNVVEDQFHVTTQEPVHISIFNDMGQLVLEKDLIVGNHSVNVSHLNGNLFYIKIENSLGQSLTRKIIVERN